MDEGLNIQEYLDSGVLELYVSGVLPEAEAQEVAVLAGKYPEIQEEISRIEQTMMQYFEAYAGDGPSDSILSRALEMIEEEEKEDPPIIPLTPPAPQSPSSPWRWLAVAAVALLVVSVILNLFLFSEVQEIEGKYDSLLAQNTQLAEQNESLQTSLEQDQRLITHLSDPDSKEIPLNGLDISQESRAAVVWNPRTDEVLLAAHSLPQPQAGFQYQLWAIVDGKPVSAGVFDHAKDNQFLLSVVGDAIAFAITLEKEGGVESPTLDQMYVYGELG